MSIEIVYGFFGRYGVRRQCRFEHLRHFSLIAYVKNKIIPTTALHSQLVFKYPLAPPPPVLVISSTRIRQENIFFLEHRLRRRYQPLNNSTGAAVNG